MGKRLIRKRNKSIARGSDKPEQSDFEPTPEPTEPRTDDANDGDANESSTDNNHSEYTNPDDYTGSGAGDSGDGTGTGTGTSKRRGRRKGSRNKASQKAQTNITSRILFSIHAMAASMLKAQTLNLSLEESEKLAEAIQHVQEQYEMLVLTEKQEAWLNLAIVGVGIYGPRIVAQRLIWKMEKEAQKRNSQIGPQIFEMPDLEAIKRSQNVQGQST